MSTPFAVECLTCREDLYYDIDHMKVAYKVILNKDKGLYSNYCFNCLIKFLKDPRSNVHIETQLLKFHCNDKYCELGCELYEGSDKSFWAKVVDPAELENINNKIKE
jgi:hypothetical protein